MASPGTAPPRRVGLIHTREDEETASQAQQLSEAGCTELCHLDPLNIDGTFEHLRVGDTLVVPSLDVLGPPLRGAIMQVHHLLAQGVCLVALAEGLHMTPSADDRQSAVFLTLNKCVKIWEQSRTEARKRTLQSRHKRAGRHPKLTAADEARVLDLLSASGASVSKVARTLVVGRTTLYRYLSQFGHVINEDSVEIKNGTPESIGVF